MHFHQFYFIDFTLFLLITTLVSAQLIFGFGLLVGTINFDQ